MEFNRNHEGTERENLEQKKVEQRNEQLESKLNDIKQGLQPGENENSKENNSDSKNESKSDEPEKIVDGKEIKEDNKSDIDSRLASIKDDLKPEPNKNEGQDITGQENKGMYNSHTMKHVFHGEINERGKAVGYHHESMMGGRIIPGTERPPDRNGVYMAKVEVDGERKLADSSFFPKEWNRADVLKAIDEAYQSRHLMERPDGRESNKYRGISSSGIKIEMYLNKDGSIATAYPLYRR